MCKKKLHIMHVPHRTLMKCSSSCCWFFFILLCLIYSSFDYAFACSFHIFSSHPIACVKNGAGPDAIMMFILTGKYSCSLVFFTSVFFRFQIFQSWKQWIQRKKKMNALNWMIVRTLNQWTDWKNVKYQWKYTYTFFIRMSIAYGKIGSKKNRIKTQHNTTRTNILFFFVIYVCEHSSGHIHG